MIRTQLFFLSYGRVLISHTDIVTTTNANQWMPSKWTFSQQIRMSCSPPHETRTRILWHPTLVYGHDVDRGFPSRNPVLLCALTPYLNLQNTQRMVSGLLFTQPPFINSQWIDGFVYKSGQRSSSSSMWCNTRQSLINNPSEKKRRWFGEQFDLTSMATSRHRLAECSLIASGTILPFFLGTSFKGK